MIMNLKEFKQYLTTQELSEVIGFSESYINQHLKNKIENVHFKGAGRKWNPKSVERFIEMHKVTVK